MGAKCTSKDENRKEAARHWVPKTHRALGSITPAADGAAAPAPQTAGQFPCGTDDGLATQTGESQFSKQKP